jgi:hypothetical protein
MPNDAQTLPDDPSRLKDMVTEGLRECDVLMGELKSRDILIEKLKHQLAGMRQHRYGSRSEALDQLALSLEDEAIVTSAQETAQDEANAVEADRPAASKGQPKRRPLPDHLPRNEMVLSAGATVRAGKSAIDRTGALCNFAAPLRTPPLVPIGPRRHAEDPLHQCQRPSWCF